MDIHASSVLHKYWSRWPLRCRALSRCGAASGPEVNVPEFLELHDPDDPALGQNQRLGRQLLSCDAEILHRIPASAEGHALPLQHFERLLERGIHRALYELLQRRAEHHELEGFDILPSADSGHMISDIPHDELRLIKARVVQLVEDPVLSRVLLEVGGICLRQRHEDDGYHETWNPAAPDAHSPSYS